MDYMRNIRWGFARLSSILAVALLAACGGGGPGGGGGTPPPVAETVLKVEGTLAPYQHDERTRIWIRTLGGVDETGGGTTTWYQGEPFAVGSDGAFSIDVDAEQELGLPAIAPSAFAAWLLPAHPDGVAALDISATPEAAELKVLNGIVVYQPDIETGSYNMGSHQVEYIFEEGNRQVYGRPVFSDRAVTITAGWSREDFAPYEMNVSLVAGWNLVYQQFIPETLKLVINARAFDPSVIPTIRPVIVLQARVTDTGMSGYSVVPTHLLGEASLESLYYQQQGASNPLSIQVPRWLGFATAIDSPLVPLGEAFPQLTGSVATDNDANGLMATILGYDNVDGSTDWQNDEGLSAGSLSLRAENGNLVYLVYSDRTTVLDLEGTADIGGDTVTIRTQEFGTDLNHGWNALELRPLPGNPNERVLMPFTGFIDDALLIAP